MQIYPLFWSLSLISPAECKTLKGSSDGYGLEFQLQSAGFTVGFRVSVFMGFRWLWHSAFDFRVAHFGSFFLIQLCNNLHVTTSRGFDKIRHGHRV